MQGGKGRAVKLILAVPLGIFLGFWAGSTVSLVHRDQYAWMVRALPTPVRTAYLDGLFQRIDGDCDTCYIELLGALDALHDPRLKGYRYDVDRIAGLVNRDDDNVREPVGALACDVLMDVPGVERTASGAPVMEAASRHCEAREVWLREQFGARGPS